VKVVLHPHVDGLPRRAWIAEQVDLTVRGIDGVEDVESELVFTPPWTPDRMSDDAKFALGILASAWRRKYSSPSAGRKYVRSRRCG
jgi:metal-sulfur cluster biosynthetic enzyme